MVTIKQIAERAGVSTATVSNVIHGKFKHVSADTVKRIQWLIDDMGYVRDAGRQVLSRQHSTLVATILRYQIGFENSVLADPFYGIVTGTIEEELRKRGCYMMLFASSDMDEIIRMLMTWDVDGILAVSPSIEECKKIQNLIGKPMVSIDASGTDGVLPEIPDVGLEDEKGGHLMVWHLLELGYETIYVAGTSNNGIDRRRWLGAREVCSTPLFQEGRKKLEFLELGTDRQQREERYEQVLHQLPFRKKTAFFFMSDTLAMEAVSYWAERGVQVPKDFGVCGFDNSVNAVHFSIPPLTTISQDMQMKGRVAVEELVCAIRDPDYVPKSHRLPVALVSRQSV